MGEIASKYEVFPRTLQEWKKQFLANMQLAFDKSAVVKEYKEEIEVLQKQNSELAKKVGTLTLERDWLMGKLRSLDLSIKKTMVDNSEGVQAKMTQNPSNRCNTSSLFLNRQLELLLLSKVAYYYRPIKAFSRDEDQRLLELIDKIHTKHPYYGTRRIVKILSRLEVKAGRKLVKTAMKFMGIRAQYPKPKTTISNKKPLKYPYLLDRFKNQAHQVVT